MNSGVYGNVTLGGLVNSSTVGNNALSTTLASTNHVVQGNTTSIGLI